MNDLNTLSMDLSNMLLPWIGVLISLVVAIWFKDFATGLAKGLKFKWDPAFKEGDEVLLDGELAMIVKIGVSKTVFGVYSDRGYTWRYVPNERIPVLKLEKVIKKDLHVDTEEEKAQKMKTLIDKAQDEEILANKKAIERLTTEFAPGTIKGKAAKLAMGLTPVEQEKFGRRIKMVKRSVPALLIVGAIGGLVAILVNQ